MMLRLWNVFRKTDNVKNGNIPSSNHDLISSSPASMSDLPAEMINHISQFMSLHDRIEARTLDRVWHYQSLWGLKEVLISHLTAKFPMSSVSPQNQLHLRDMDECQKYLRLILQETGKTLVRLHLHRINLTVALSSCDIHSINYTQFHRGNESMLGMTLEEMFRSERRSFGLEEIVHNNRWCIKNRRSEEANLLAQADNEKVKQVNYLNGSLVELIGLNCVKLRALHLSYCIGISEETLNFLLNRLGKQLEEVHICQVRIPQLVQMLLDKLNCEKLRCLSVSVVNQSMFHALCTKFINLEKLSVDSYELLDLSVLGNLTQLGSFKLTHHHYEYVDFSSIVSEGTARTLHTLRLKTVGIGMITLLSFERLKSLRTLQITVTADEQLDYVFDNLSQLKFFDVCLQLFPMVRNWFKLHKLNRLNTLRIKCHNIALLQFNQSKPMWNIRHLSLLSRYFSRSGFEQRNMMNVLSNVFPCIVSLELTDQWSLPSRLFKLLESFASLRDLRLYINQTQRDEAIEKLATLRRRVKVTLVLCLLRNYTHLLMPNNYQWLVPQNIEILPLLKDY